MSKIIHNDFYTELKNGIDILTSMIEEFKTENNIEIELRLGQIQFNEFKAGLGSEKFFEIIKKRLDTAKCWTKVLNNKYEELCLNGLRRTMLINGKKVIKNQCIRKEKIKNINLEYCETPYDIRISISREIPSEEKLKSGTGILRKKDRYSYYYKDYIIDLTNVEQIDNGVSVFFYELEVEFINLKSDISDKYRAHSGLLLMRDIINMCEEIQENSKLILFEK